MSETILSIRNLTKHYGRIHAVNALSLEVKKGEVYGILGPNGSGKTTTLGMILDVVNPTSTANESVRYWNNLSSIPTYLQCRT